MDLESVLLAYHKLIRRSSAGSMSGEQYAKVASCIFGATKGGILIFGLGYDTRFWSTIACGRLLTVIEDNPSWIAAATQNDVEIIETRYTSNVGHPSSFPEAFEELVPRSNEWGTVFVDGPRGALPSDPGREQSIRLASEIRARSGAAVFVHDYERRWEQHCSSMYLGFPDEVVSSVGDHRLLAYWKENCGSSGGNPETGNDVGDDSKPSIQ